MLYWMPRLHTSANCSALTWIRANIHEHFTLFPLFGITLKKQIYVSWKYPWEEKDFRPSYGQFCSILPSSNTWNIWISLVLAFMLLILFSPFITVILCRGTMGSSNHRVMRQEGIGGKAPYLLVRTLHWLYFDLFKLHCIVYEKVRIASWLCKCADLSWPNWWTVSLHPHLVVWISSENWNRNTNQILAFSL